MSPARPSAPRSGIDDLVLAVEAHRQHMAPLVDELSRSPDSCLQRIARMLEVQGRHLDRLCAELDRNVTPGAGAAG